MSNPDWPGTAGFPALPYRGAWTEKSVQLPFATGNGESAGTTPKVFWGTGNPNGVVTAKPGDHFYATDTGMGWTKLTGTATNTGWGFVANWLDARAFGVKGDGVTDDTSALLAWLTAAAGVGVACLPAPLVCLTGELSVATTITIFGGGTLKLKSQPVSVTGVLTLDGAGSLVDGITIDCNSFEDHGINIATTATGTVIRNVTVKNITGANIGGSTSGISVNAANCQVSNYTASNLLVGTDSNASIPRMLSTGGSAADTLIRGLYGTTVNVIAVIATPRTTIQDVVVNGAYGDGFYCVSGSTDTTVDGVAVTDVGNTFVTEDARLTVRNAVVRFTAQTAANIALNLDNGGSDLVAENVRVYAGTTYNSALIASRSGLAGHTFTGVKLRNCLWVGMNANGSGGIQFSSGTVNGLQVHDCYVEFHQAVALVGEGRLVVHTAGDKVSYRNNTFALLDDEGTLTNANTFRLIVPTVSALSYWQHNRLVTDPSHQCAIRVDTVTQDLVAVDSSISPLEAGAKYLREQGLLNPKGPKVVRSSAAPSGGTWDVGDFCWNTAPAEAGGAGSKYVILGWTCTAGGTPGTWLQCRTLTGN